MNPDISRHWLLEPGLRYLNHGSFGACPRVVLDEQARWRARLEENPVRFMLDEVPGALERARTELARFLGATPEGIVFIRNATEGANAVLRSIKWATGDEIVTTSHDYNAVRNVMRALESEERVKIIIAEVPFPLSGEDEVIRSVEACLSTRTKLLVLDHITSPTALIFPIEKLIAIATQGGIATLIDGAHAPGMLPLSLSTLGATYYVGNLHKWVCAPKGAAFLYAAAHAREALLPSVISHGYNCTFSASRYQSLFDWPGTLDPTAWLSVPKALEWLSAQDPNGFSGIMRRNRDRALEARALLKEALEVALPAPESMIGSMATLPLPPSNIASRSALEIDPIQRALFDRARIVVPIFSWPLQPLRVLRVSAQIYNDRSDYEALAALIPSLLSSPA